MSDIKLKAASGGGSISIKGPSSAGSDTDFLDTSGNLKVTADAIVDGRVNIGSTGGFDSNGDDLTITNASHGGITIKTGTSSDGIIRFGDGSGAAEYRGYINYKHADDALCFGTSTNERLRIASDGKVYINRTSALDSNYLSFSATKALSAGIPQNQINIADAAAYNTTDNGGAIGFSAKFTSGGGYTTMASIEGVKRDNTDGNYNGDMVFKTRSHNGNNIERMRLNDGGLRLPSGYGINFSATSDGTTMSSEVLDDYEEGTWVPDVKGYNSAGSTTYNSNRLGQYIKIGRQVTAWFYVGWTAQDGSGSLAITLPFTCSDTSAHQVAGSVFFDSIDTDGSAVNHALHTWHNVNVTLIYYSLDNGGWSGVSVDSAGSVIGTLTYLVA